MLFIEKLNKKQARRRAVESVSRYVFKQDGSYEASQNVIDGLLGSEHTKKTRKKCVKTLFLNQPITLYKSTQHYTKV